MVHIITLRYDTLRYVTFHALSALLFTPVFYLGYLRGRSSSPLPKKEKKKKIYIYIYIYILLSLQYISIYIGKIIQTRLVHTLDHFSKLYQNAPDCISGHIHFKTFPGRHAPGPPLEALSLQPLGTFPPNDKS